MKNKDVAEVRRNIQIAHTILCLTQPPFSVEDAVSACHASHKDMRFSQEEIEERIRVMAESGVLVNLPWGYVPRGVFNRDSYRYLRL